jgi:CheY-like chemotaxis protein
MSIRFRKKIIYVDDINYSLLVAKDRLKQKFEVYPAQSVEKLFELLEYIDPDLILLDINMPGTDGYEALRQLKSNPVFSNIPVIFLTAQMDKDSVLKGISLGAVAHVGKPYSIPSLIDTIESALSADKKKIKEKEDPNKLRILAIDDVSSMLMALRYALSDTYTVYTLSKPEELKSFLQKKKPDLFLLDYNMPVINGFELVPIIRGYPEHQETPIIFLTGEGTTDHLAAAIHLGVSDFLVKPFETKALREKIAKHIKREG